MDSYQVELHRVASPLKTLHANDPMHNKHMSSPLDKVDASLMAESLVL